MKGDFKGVVGHYGSAEALQRAVEGAREAYFTGADLELYLPVGDKATVEKAVPGTSRSRWLALGGGITGIVLGLWMTIGMSRDWPLVTGGKPIVSLPPFLVIAFELMILFAALGAVAGFLWFARLPALSPSSAYRQELAVDRFALLIRCLPEEGPRTRAVEALKEAGALEIRSVYERASAPLGDVP
jgi:hypothetical protein